MPAATMWPGARRNASPLCVCVCLFVRLENLKNPPEDSVVKDSCSNDPIHDGNRGRSEH